MCSNGKEAVQLPARDRRPELIFGQVLFALGDDLEVALGGRLELEVVGIEHDDSCLGTLSVRQESPDAGECGHDCDHHEDPYDLVLDLEESPELPSRHLERQAKPRHRSAPTLSSVPELRLTACT